MLSRVHELVAARVVEGHVTHRDPDICFYRLSQPQTITKTATFGVVLGVVLQGSKHVRIGEHELVASASQLLLITRDTEHEITTAGVPYTGFYISFNPERVAKALLALSDAGAVSSDETVPAFVMETDPQIAGALERLIVSLDDPIDRKLLAPLAIDEILYRLLRSDSAAAIRSAVAHTPDAVRIVESMRYIREHHKKKLSIETLARHARMSPSHFAHRFSSIARISPMRFLREVRLERARSLLFENGHRASEVASSVGFESAAHFAREFKRRYGVPPTHYLRTRPT